MRFRRATAADWAGVLALQEANLLANLGEAQRAQGFLSVRFSREQFEQMNEGAAVVVAHDGDRIAGYACSSTQAFNAGVPVIAAMIASFPALWLLGRSLATPATAIYGPVCVDRRDRGRGVFGGMVRQLKSELKGRFDTAAGFVAKSNTHSLAAHVDGAGMSLLGDFVFDGRNYWIVAFPVAPEAISCVL
jgi:hypothetical protein